MDAYVFDFQDKEYSKRDRKGAEIIHPKWSKEKQPVISLLSETRLSIECGESETMKLGSASTICCQEFLSIHDKRRKIVISPKEGSMSEMEGHKYTVALTSRKSSGSPEPHNDKQRSKETSQDYNTQNLFTLVSSIGHRHREADSLSRTHNSNHHYNYRVSNMSQRHLWTTVSMVFTTIIVLSSFSSATIVACVPLRRTSVEGALDITGSDIKDVNGVMNGKSPPPSPILHFHPINSMGDQQPHELRQVTDRVLRSKSAYATISKVSKGTASQGVESNMIPQHSHSASQKHRKDVIRSVSANTYDGYDTIEDSEEIENTIGSKVEIPLASTSSLMRLEKVGLPTGSMAEESNTIPTEGLNEFSLSTAGESDSEKWETVINPRLYILTELGINSNQEPLLSVLRQQRKRRNSGTGPSLSIVNPLDVLRQRLLLEIARRRMRQSQNRIIANEEYLRKIGKR